jgi:hypothetical protein
MSIPESTLTTWSHQGSVQQSAATYQSIKSTLEDLAAPYSSRSFSTYLQGSYGNDTNIWADSDVDVVICTSSVFYYDLANLDASASKRFESQYPGSATYSYHQFKGEVVKWLTSNYGNAVRPGSKAVRIVGSGNRRDADVLPAAEFRHYWSFEDAASENYATGIVFWTVDGRRIVNFPKQHALNCTAKHQRTSSWFKPTVRVFKNMRNRMVIDGVLEEGVAPSYYVEGLLSNVADSCFGRSFQITFLQCLDYLVAADKGSMTCANGIHWLVRDGKDVCWSNAQFNKFMSALPSYWRDFTG